MNVEPVWSAICQKQGEPFKTVRGVTYRYVVCDEYILINNDKRRKITKDAIKLAIEIENPTPSKLMQEGLWGASYICGIINDSRIRD